ncbi:hypothetical protein [Halomonas halmophila]|uniref:hypothetical protein n=1 Tax=Halomonas halmophila TaxID=252 RepID=UPI0011448250|nr:hypothetical protein [Halomonas halmophila]
MPPRFLRQTLQQPGTTHKEVQYIKRFIKNYLLNGLEKRPNRDMNVLAAPDGVAKRRRARFE